MTVANGQAGAAQAVPLDGERAASYRKAAEITRDAGIKSTDVSLPAMAQERPEPFARVLDALAELEAEHEAGG